MVYSTYESHSVDLTTECIAGGAFIMRFKSAATSWLLFARKNAKGGIEVHEGGRGDVSWW
jgi:hypothetical protein